MWPRLGRLWSSHSGVAAVEFALVVLPLMALLFGLMGIGLMYFDRATLQSAVEVAGRSIATNAQSTQSQLTTIINSRLTTIGSPAVTVAYATTTVGGVSVGHLSATLSRSYSIPMFAPLNLTYIAETYVPLGT